MKLRISWIVCLLLVAGFFVSPAPAVFVKGDTGPISDGVYVVALNRPVALSPGTAEAPGPELTTLSPALTWKAVTGAEDSSVYVSNYPYGSANIVWSRQGVTGTSVTIPNGILVHGKSTGGTCRPMREPGGRRSPTPSTSRHPPSGHR